MPVAGEIAGAAGERWQAASSAGRRSSLPSRAILLPIDSCPQSDMIGGLYWAVIVWNACGSIETAARLTSGNSRRGDIPTHPAQPGC
jgi:hypothetical protein